MSNRDRACACAGALTLAVLFSFAGLGPLSAQTQSPLAGSFDELFSNEVRVAPLFTRPDVTSRLPELPPSPDESAPATTVSTSPPESSEAQGGPEGADKKGLASALKKLVISPAEAETSPAPPPAEAVPPSAPSATAAVPAATPNDPVATGSSPAPRRTAVGRISRPMARMRASQKIKVTRLGRPVARGTLKDGRPTTFSQLRPLGSGRAVWYQHPGRTASGETFNPNGLTAAHRTLPLGTRVRVVNKKNGRSVVVRINDRMPAKLDYAIDLSRGSARVLGIEGVGSVAIYKAR